MKIDSLVEAMQLPIDQVKVVGVKTNLTLLKSMLVRVADPDPGRKSRLALGPRDSIRAGRRRARRTRNRCPGNRDAQKV